MAYSPKLIERVMRIEHALVSKTIWISLGLLVLSAQGQTFSPYTPEQIQEFNQQAIAPVETPMGPIDSDAIPRLTKPASKLDARYLSSPEGEAQAEAQETQSAAPFTPMPNTIAF